MIPPLVNVPSLSTPFDDTLTMYFSAGWLPASNTPPLLSVTDFAVERCSVSSSFLFKNQTALLSTFMVKVEPIS